MIRSGADGEVLRLLPPFTLTDGELDLGLARLGAALDAQAARVA